MTDYDEQIKSLRRLSETQVDIDWQFAVQQAMTEAADSIEELSKLAEAIPHVCECCIGCELEKKNGGCDNAFVLSLKRAMQYLIKPRWITVEEKQMWLDWLKQEANNG